MILFVVVFSLSCELRIGNILSLQIFMYLIFYIFFYSLMVCRRLCASVCEWRLADNLWESVLLLLYRVLEWNSGSQAQWQVPSTRTIPLAHCSNKVPSALSIHHANTSTHLGSFCGSGIAESVTWIFFPVVLFGCCCLFVFLFAYFWGP